MTYPTWVQTVATVPRRAAAYLQVPVAFGKRQLPHNPARMHFALSFGLPFTTGPYKRMITQGSLILLGSTRCMPHTRCSCPYARAWRCLPCVLVAMLSRTSKTFLRGLGVAVDKEEAAAAEFGGRERVHGPRVKLEHRLPYPMGFHTSHSVSLRARGAGGAVGSVDVLPLHPAIG